MSEQINQNDAYVRKFSFRPFTGFRRGRLYRIWSISWQWWTHEWDRSRAIKVLIGFQLFTLLITNIIILSFKNTLLLSPLVTPESLLEDTLIPLVRGIVSFRTEIHTESNGSGDEFGGGVLIYAPDISQNQINILAHALFYLIYTAFYKVFHDWRSSLKE